jgi:YHS domain-containing protein
VPFFAFMLRAAIELLITILVILVARVILTSVLRGIANASSAAFRRGNPDFQGQTSSSSAPQPQGSELHKDPVCGTYVAETTPFRHHAAGQIFYYCSAACREKHSLVAR